MSKYSKHTHTEFFTSLRLCPLSEKGSGELRKDYFYWEFDVKPTTFSRVYKVLLIWDFTQNAPKVYVLNKEVLEVSKIKNIPHLYNKEKVQLCLYHPSYQEFSSSMSLCETIVPWTNLWISYYEEWLYSDKWKGGGEHPKLSSERKISALKKIRVPKSIKKKRIKKSLVDIVYERRRKLFEQSLNIIFQR